MHFHENGNAFPYEIITHKQIVEIIHKHKHNDL